LEENQAIEETTNQSMGHHKKVKFDAQLRIIDKTNNYKYYLLQIGFTSKTIKSSKCIRMDKFNMREISFILC
jgi:hypothetical protein